MKARRLLVMACAAGLLLGQPASAHACSCEWYTNRFYAEDGGSIPVDGRGLLWLTDNRRPAEALTVWRVREGALEPVEFELVKLSEDRPDVRPTPPDLYLIEVPGLAVGERLRFRAKSHDVSVDEQDMEVDVEVGPAMPADAKPLSLRTRRRAFRWLTVAMAGECAHRVTAVTLDLELDIPEQFEGMRGALWYSTIVDGKPWVAAHSLCGWPDPGTNWMRSPGIDRVYVTCNPREGRSWWRIPRDTGGLTPGRHEAYVEARLPIPGLEFRSNTVEFELRCAGDRDPQQEAPPASKAGCSTSGQSSSWLALVLLVLVGRITSAARRRPPSG